MDERPWLKQYDKGVPHTLEYPDVPLFYFLEEAARWPFVGAVRQAGFMAGIELAADVLGVTVDELIEQRNETGKTVHEILEDADKLDEFTEAHLAQIKTILAEKVTNGDLTQAEADEWYKQIETRMQENIENGTYGRGSGFGMMRGYFSNGTGTGRCG